MENTTLSKYTKSFGLSLALCALLNALLVIAKEESTVVTDWMQKVTGHHWITHVVIILVLFAVSGWCLASMNRSQGPKTPFNRLTGIILAGVSGGILIIFAFYLIAD